MLSFIPNHQEHCMIPTYPTNNIPAPNAESLLQFLYTRQDYGANISGDDERVVLGVRIPQENNILPYECVPVSGLIPACREIRVAHPTADCYICKSLQKSAGTWRAANAKTFTFLSVDIDAHTYAKNLTSEEMLSLCKNAAEYVCFALGDEAGLPTPNAVSYSGRGFHLFWAIHPVDAQYREEVCEVSTYLGNAADKLLHSSNLYRHLYNDTQYAKRPSGLMRIPETVNTKSGTLGCCQLHHTQRIDIFSLLDRIKDCGGTATPSLSSAKPTSTDVKDLSSQEYDPEHTRSVGLSRFFALKRLATMRNGIAPGLRHIFLLIYFCSCLMAGMDGKQAEEEALKMNSEFPKPLNPMDVKNSLSSARKQKYSFRTSNIIRELKISPAELREIHLHPFSKTNAEKNAARGKRSRLRREEKLRRYREAFEACSGHIAAAARRANCSYNTMKKYAQFFKN